MSWTRIRGLTCLAVVLIAASTALAADSFYSASTAGFGGLDISSEPSGALNNAGIDRLLQVNATQDSLFRSESSSSPEASVEPADSTAAIAPIADVTSGPARSRGTYVLAGCCAAFALGLGLCCAGMMSGRQRTLNTFTAGFTRMK